MQLIFDYSRGRRLVFSSITDNAKTGNELWIYGDEGSVQLTIEDATFFYEKNSHHSQPTEGVVKQQATVTGASYSTANEMPYRGPGEKLQTNTEDPTLCAVRSFVEAVRGEHEIAADLMVGFRSAVASSVAHEAVQTERKMSIPPPRQLSSL